MPPKKTAKSTETHYEVLNPKASTSTAEPTPPTPAHDDGSDTEEEEEAEEEDREWFNAQASSELPDVF